MKVETFIGGFLATNSYGIIKDNKCLIIDAPENLDKFILKLKSENIVVEGLILTHGHYDHIEGGESLKDIPIYIYEDEIEFLNEPNLNLSFELGKIQKNKFENVNCLKVGKAKIGSFEVEIIHSPGHTSGSISILIGDNLFTGDTIFAGSYGRYDFPTGNFNDLAKSVVKIIDRFDDNVVVYPGHGESTTIKKEKENPLYLYVKNK